MGKMGLIVFIIVVLSYGTVSFSAEAPVPPLMVKDYEGIPYVSGGIGLDEREALRAMAKDYNLKLVFAIKEGNYLADIGVLIKNAQGKTVLEAVSDGPWFYAKLPGGQYTVTAIMMEKTNTQNMQIKPAGHSVLHFYWAE